MHPRAAELIRLLDLRPHPEGGHYREVFRSAGAVRPADGRGDRPGLTAITFLLAAGEVSRWHRLASDEVWHHYEGDPLELFLLDGDRLERRRLGPAGPESGPVVAVPAGCWQAARPEGAYALAGCSVGPGFDFADFRLMADDPAAVDALRRPFPDLAALL
jgi:hypothetical protein